MILRQPSSWRRIILLPTLLLTTIIYLTQPFSNHHTISPYDAFSTSIAPPPGTPSGLLSLPEAELLCAAHNWKAYPYRDSRRKIYDLIMVNNELDWLEIRLATMSPYVDFFVILESPITFTGLAKPLLLTQPAALGILEPYQSMIIHKVVENMPLAGARRAWDLEDFQRNAMLLQGVLGEKDHAEKGVKEGDILIVADVDEIVKPEALRVLRECEVPRRVTLRSQFYYYGFQFRHIGSQWPHPQATIYSGNSTILPADLRNGEGGGTSKLAAWWEKADLWNAGWHCSSCFATIEDLLNKMSSFSHMTLNLPQFRERSGIVERVRNGRDLWDRVGEEYETLVGNGDIPEVLKTVQGMKKFGYLLDRKGPNAGFTDFEVEKSKDG